MVLSLKSNRMEKMENLFRFYITLSDRHQRVVSNGSQYKARSPSRFIAGTPPFSHLHQRSWIKPYQLDHFFGDGTSIFTIVKEPKTAASNLNIAKQDYQWKISSNPISNLVRFLPGFEIASNPDPKKPVQEILFSSKKTSPLHPHC